MMVPKKNAPIQAWLEFFKYCESLNNKQAYKKADTGIWMLIEYKEIKKLVSLLFKLIRLQFRVRSQFYDALTPVFLYDIVFSCNIKATNVIIDDLYYLFKDDLYKFRTNFEPYVRDVIFGSPLWVAYLLDGKLNNFAWCADALRIVKETVSYFTDSSWYASLVHSWFLLKDWECDRDSVWLQHIRLQPELWYDILKETNNPKILKFILRNFDIRSIELLNHF